ncbi:S-layer homology domain-containing protein [uncultured Microbacterium sp.]|uniref:S-layer homology domain-containing protein n=1 Tax=uncultured Microbacterium sp. TaxID=191216 RepID=UPI002628CA8F|nr:S-layer homology domain-containing protein [uncultured Microbacterium sp.]
MDNEFYREITWLASAGVSTGWVSADGVAEFRPFEPISRDAMAAFLYRFDAGATPARTHGSQFTDVTPALSAFSGEIEWLASLGITAGYDRPGGSTDYRPFAHITRDAMAAFLYRYDRGGMDQFSASAPNITGIITVRQVVSASAGSWTPSPTTLTYQWLRDGQPIAGATSPQYTIGIADAGREITVRVSGERPGYLRLARQSAAFAVPTEVGGRLLAGETMPIGTTLRSPDGGAELTIDRNGELRVTRGGELVWRSPTVGTPAAALALSSSGILSLIRTDGSIAWTSTPVGGTAAKLLLSDDGRLEIVLGDGRTSWSSAVQGMVQFDFPFEPGERWAAGGPHGGLGSSSWNSLDFGPSPGRPGSTRVVSIASGIVRWLACGSRGYLAVEHEGGWRSGYYHLVNPQTQLVGTRVEKGTYLGDVGSEVPCGGSSTFDHVHLQITYLGVPVPMNGFVIGGYTVYSSGSPYYGYWVDSSGQRVLTAPGGARCCIAADSS